MRRRAHLSAPGVARSSNPNNFPIPAAKAAKGLLMIWRDLVFDYLWERASPLCRSLMIAVVLGAIVLLLLAIVQLANAGHGLPTTLHAPITRSTTSTVPTP